MFHQARLMSLFTSLPSHTTCLNYAQLKINTWASSKIPLALNSSLTAPIHLFCSVPILLAPLTKILVDLQSKHSNYENIPNPNTHEFKIPAKMLQRFPKFEFMAVVLCAFFIYLVLWFCLCSALIMVSTKHQIFKLTLSMLEIHTRKNLG